jgi:hypothetical protein
MNHSRYNLPNRICGLALVAAAASFGCWDIVTGQGPGPAAAPAGIAPAAPAGSIAPASIVAPTARAALPDPQQLLEGCCRMLGRQKSIVAKVRSRATIYDRELIGSGDYAQGPELARLLRYELRMQVDDRVVNLLQVADGRHLWISSILKEEPEIQRIDIDRVLAALDAEAGAAGFVDPNRRLGLGGLSQLMAGIAKDFEFNKVFRSQLDGLPVLGIEGRWKAEALATLVPKAKGKADAGRPKTDTMRPHVPDRIVLYLGADDLFPYRFEYRRSTPMKETAGQNVEAAFDVDGPSKPLLVLEFFQVHFDVPIEERKFQFTPGAFRVADITDKFLAARKAVP